MRILCPADWKFLSQYYKQPATREFLLDVIPRFPPFSSISTVPLESQRKIINDNRFLTNATPSWNVLILGCNSAPNILHSFTATTDQLMPFEHLNAWQRFITELRRWSMKNVSCLGMFEKKNVITTRCAFTLGTSA